MIYCATCVVKLQDGSETTSHRKTSLAVIPARRSGWQIDGAGSIGLQAFQTRRFGGFSLPLRLWQRNSARSANAGFKEESPLRLPEQDARNGTARLVQDHALQAMGRDDRSLLEPFKLILCGLWRARHCRLPAMADGRGRRNRLRVLPRRHGRACAPLADNGTPKFGWRIFPGELRMGEPDRAKPQSAFASISHVQRQNPVCGRMVRTNRDSIFHSIHAPAPGMVSRKGSDTFRLVPLPALQAGRM